MRVLLGPCSCHTVFVLTAARPLTCFLSSSARLLLLYQMRSEPLSLFTFKKFMFPINENGCHWTLTVVDLENRKTLYFNSLRALRINATRYFRLVRQWLRRMNELSPFGYSDQGGCHAGQMTDGALVGVPPSMLNPRAPHWLCMSPRRLDGRCVSGAPPGRRSELRYFRRRDRPLRGARRRRLSLFDAGHCYTEEEHGGVSPQWPTVQAG